MSERVYLMFMQNNFLKNMKKYILVSLFALLLQRRAGFW